MGTENSLAHTKWEYKYHIVFAPKYSVSEVMGYLKGKSSLMIFEKHANLKYKYGNRHFWCRGYYVDKVEKNAAEIKKYIQNQRKEDLE
ncbi:MAG: IS200/IS605 family transposase, partial [Lachnospiraceae bacterium]|nr:IS200/IS605 family transposase [Lachnospiraceae bacterium]